MCLSDQTCIIPNNFLFSWVDKLRRLRFTAEETVNAKTQLLCKRIEQEENFKHAAGRGRERRREMFLNIELTAYKNSLYNNETII